MKMADTDKLKTEYVETYNRYMTLPDDSKELKTLAKKLQDMEQALTRRFLFESGYATEKKGEYCIFVEMTAPFSYLIFCNFAINLLMVSRSSTLSASRDISLIFSVKSSI